MLRPSPLDIPGLFAGTFSALKQRLGLFVLITILPVVLGVVLIISGLAILITSLAIAASGNRAGLPIGILVGVAFYVLGILAAGLGQLKSFGMMAVAAYEIAAGQHPDFRGLLTRTRGFLPRMATVIAIAIGCGILLGGVFFALMASSLSYVEARRQGPESAVFAVFLGVTGLLGLALAPLSFFLRTRLLYTIPATAIENLGGIGGMKRSWSLTSGAFWRTLGYYLVAYFAVSILTSLVTGFSQISMMPFFTLVASAVNSSDPSAVLASFGALIPVVAISSILILAVEVVAVPFMQSYVTYMFIDQVRRSEMPPNPFGYGSPSQGYGYGYQPGAQGQPGPYGAQPPQGYRPPAQYPTPPLQPQPPQGPWPPAQQPPESR